MKFNLLFGSVTTGLERKGFSSLLYCGNFLLLKITRRHKVLIDFLSFWLCLYYYGDCFLFEEHSLPRVELLLNNLLRCYREQTEGWAMGEKMKGLESTNW